MRANVTVRAEAITALKLGSRRGVAVAGGTAVAVSVSPYIGVRGSAATASRSSERERRRSVFAVVGVVALAFRRTRSAHSLLASASDGVMTAGRAERSMGSGEGARVWLIDGRAESGMGAGRDLGGTGSGLEGG